MVLFYNSILFQVLVNGYFIFRIKKNRFISKSFKWIGYIVILLEVLLYFTGLFFRENMEVNRFALIQTINVCWVVGGLYFLVLLSIFDLIHLWNKRIRFRRRVLFCLEIVLTALVFFALGVRLQMAKNNFIAPDTKEYAFEFQTDTPIDSLGQEHSYRIVAVSDLHLGYIINRSVLARYVDEINQQSPDIVVIAGDLIDYYLDPLIEEKADEEFRRIEAPKGVYFVLGNHEYKRDVEDNLAWIRNAGMIVLRDSVANIDDQLYLIGRDDLKNKENRMSWQELIKKTPTPERSILFVHQPNDIKEADGYHIPLAIAGHTHNGQIFPFNLIRHFNDYYYGFFEKNGMSSYTTSGLGLSGFPLMIMSHSEMLVFDITIK